MTGDASMIDEMDDVMISDLINGGVTLTTMKDGPTRVSVYVCIFVASDRRFFEIVIADNRRRNNDNRWRDDNNRHNNNHRNNNNHNNHHRNNNHRNYQGNG